MEDSPKASDNGPEDAGAPAAALTEEFIEILLGYFAGQVSGEIPMQRLEAAGVAGLLVHAVERRDRCLSRAGVPARCP